MKRISCVLLLLLLPGSLPAQPSVPPLPGERTNLAGPLLQPGSVALSRREADSLILPSPGKPLTLPSIDRFTGNEATPLQFRPLSLFAEGARIHTRAGGMVREELPPTRQYYLATNSSTGLGLAVDTESGAVSGYLTRGGDRFEVSGDILTGINFSGIEDADAGSNSCGNGDHDLSLGASTIEASAMSNSLSAAAVGDAVNYQAVVAVDTDSEWLSGLGNNTTAAMNWITDLFLAMNVFFERDVELRVLIGDVTLRTGSDPYDEPSDRLAQLNEFGQHWKDNMGHVERQFATMLSGRNVCTGCFSGIAWLNQYCEYGRSWGSNVPGSFSFNAIGSSRTATGTALYVGHEIAHNLGSTHTHCYNPPVDRCYNGENGCYDGAVECPAGGRGTIMSYCHVGGANGAGCGTSQSEFHPTVQSYLENRLASESVAGCIIPYAEVAPEPEFVAVPAAGSELNFGQHAVGESSGLQVVRVSNAGDADLTLSCQLSGSGQASYEVFTCPPLVTPGASQSVAVSCTPASAGPQPATLILATNDSDEVENAIALACAGLAPQAGEIIFGAGFEE